MISFCHLFIDDVFLAKRKDDKKMPFRLNKMFFCNMLSVIYLSRI